MGYLIALDDGHGMSTAGKRTPYIPSLNRFIKENEFNRKVVNNLEEELNRSGLKTVLVAPGDEDTPLSTRVSRANQAKADAYISVHYNAYDGSFSSPAPSGIELFVYPGHLNREAGRLAESIGKRLKKGTGQYYRGIKEADFQVLRTTSMPAVLTENGFMDNLDEALYMIKPEFQKEVAREHAQGICDFFRVPYVSDSAKRKPSYVGRRVESIYDGRLRFYHHPSWSDRSLAGYLEKGYGFPVILSRLSVDGYFQYEVENSKGARYYVTASKKYVRVVN
ncbi:N-acetylmuramoyl-L-alanine amidase [Halobacillus sp. A1]|uniref:N-acetylmuramoyl-L-alanine amidase family protein n=1 Tax=Halobacillus sp. A1 TaxID=2880262 RepID=UPI0020A6793C|nr:N-acetylmuramoyl-L-alanine amidase [Halobacillus sp. A1]MCP3032250.1 N-acetylmuramoyl-L-alanine amidase [Halobacillus sp. A1]